MDEGGLRRRSGRARRCETSSATAQQGVRATWGRGTPATPHDGHCGEGGATPRTHATFGMSEGCLDRTQGVGGVAPTYGRYATVQAIPPLAPMTWPVT